jgi:receptor protein-tyrosine kinase
LAVGLALSAGLAVLWARLDTTVRSSEAASAATGAPVIGVVFSDEHLAREHVLNPHSTLRVAEAFRQLRTNLQFLNVDEPPKVIMITSALPGEGKTTTVVNLALMLADSGRRVTVVEADLRRPKVTHYLGLVGGIGLTNVLTGSADVADVVQSYGDRGVSVLAAGPLPPNPGELLASSQMQSLLGKLRSENDFVLVDAPPLLPVADSSGLAVYTDGVLLSVRYGRTGKEEARLAAATVERVGARILGVVLNIVPTRAEMATAYGYSYDYNSDKPGSHR